MNDSRTLEPIPEEAPWHMAKRIAFRFAFCYIVLYYAGSALYIIPGGSSIARGYSALWDWIASPIVTSVLGLDTIHTVSRLTGSGDTLLKYVENAAMLLLAVLAGSLWTVLDRRRPHYANLHGWLRILARYALAFTLLGYGLAKIFPPSQFPALTTRQLSETYGQSSPMALLWNFMGYSTAYTAFAGCAEVLPALLLLFRRTALLGSILAASVMLNIVMLNFCYDVPVKLYSLNLLCLSLFLILPDLPRLFRMFVQNRPTPSSNYAYPILKTSLRRGALTLKFAALGIFLGLTLYSGLLRMQFFRNPVPSTPLTSRGFHWIQEYPYNK